MDLNAWVKVFDRLLPRSRAWSLILDRTLRKFFHGLSILPKTIHENIGALLLEAFPQTTNYLADWSLFFGSTETFTADELEAEWGAFGGQDPKYIQDTLRAAGFDVYVHEWWVPGTNPPTARNPIALVPDSYVLVNDITTVEKDYVYQFQGVSTDPPQCVGDGSNSFGAFDGWRLQPKHYPTPDNPEEYPVYWYVCSSVWPIHATVPASDLRKLIRLIYKLKPVHTRVLLRVIALPIEDGDIQDATSAADDIQDATSAPDDLQDKI